MRFSVASGTDNSLLQLIALSNDDIELHTHEIDNNTRPYGAEGLIHRTAGYEAFNVAPHGLTQRSTYVVPANKIARVDIGAIEMLRSAVATALNYAFIRIRYTPDGGSERTLLTLFMETNTIGDRLDRQLANPFIMLEGDEINIETLDSSTGGTIDYHTQISLGEIDA